MVIKEEGLKWIWILLLLMILSGLICGTCMELMERRTTIIYKYCCSPIYYIFVNNIFIKIQYSLRKHGIWDIQGKI